MLVALFLCKRYKVQIKDKLSGLVGIWSLIDCCDEQETYIEALLIENQRLKEENAQMSKQIKEVCELLEKEDGNDNED